MILGGWSRCLTTTARAGPCIRNVRELPFARRLDRDFFAMSTSRYAARPDRLRRSLLVLAIGSPLAGGLAGIPRRDVRYERQLPPRMNPLVRLRTRREVLIADDRLASGLQTHF